MGVFLTGGYRVVACRQRCTHEGESAHGPSRRRPQRAEPPDEHDPPRADARAAPAVARPAAPGPRPRDAHPPVRLPARGGRRPRREVPPRGPHPAERGVIRDRERQPVFHVFAELAAAARKGDAQASREPAALPKGEASYETLASVSPQPGARTPR